MSRVNVQLGDNSIISLAAETSTSGTPIVNSTIKSLQSLFLSSNRLRQRTESTVSALEGLTLVNGTLEHTLQKQNDLVVNIPVSAPPPLSPTSNSNANDGHGHAPTTEGTGRGGDGDGDGDGSWV